MDIQQLAQSSRLLPWHHGVWQRLQQRFPDIGHALLFYGKQGCGKQQFASFFVKWLLCQDKQATGACGQCASCHWIAAGTHPQLKLIVPDFDEKKQQYTAIKVDQIREISSFVQQTVEGWRVVMIYPAEQLNLAAANALLKTLEEPGERVMLILISDAMLKLPATIRSRVQQYALDRITGQQAQQYLIEQKLDHPQQVPIALALAAEMPLKAEQILHSAWFAERQNFVQSWLDLVTQKTHPIKFSAYWFKQLDFRDTLSLLRYLIQDCIALKLQQQVKQSDLKLDELEKNYALAQLFALYTQINDINLMLQQNIQSQLMLDELSMRLMNVE